MLCSPCALCGRCECAFKRSLADPFFVPRLADVLPLLLLRVWKGQQGQHGERKEGRLCPALATWLPRGEGGVEGGGEEEGGQREKRDISPPLSLFLWLPLCSFSFLFVPLTCFLGLLSLIFILPLPVGSLGVQLMSKSPTKTKKTKRV